VAEKDRVLIYDEPNDKYVTIIGGLGYGDNDDQLNSPSDISFDNQGNM